MAKPRIGITAKTIFLESNQLGGSKWEDCSVCINHVDAIERAGGVPLVLPNVLGEGLARDMLDRLDGVYLSGGVDVNPLVFDEEPIAASGTIDVRRDRFELELVKAAIVTGIPILGVCRGMQVITAALGGDIFQDIHVEAETTLKHMDSVTAPVLTHSIHVTADSKLLGIMRKTKVRVNSFHHQAVKEPPKGFRVSAVAPDGVVEAIESEGEHYILGVQWHPEMLLDVSGDALNLYKSFIEAAKAFRRQDARAVSS